jgi:hypothetical protein
MTSNSKKRHKSQQVGGAQAVPTNRQQPCDLTKSQDRLHRAKIIGLGASTTPSKHSSSSKTVNRHHISPSSKFRLFLVVLGAVIYANSLQCGFVYDDQRAILENRNVQLVEAHARLDSFQDVKEWLWRVFFIDDFWGTPIRNPGSHKSYRPLVTLSFRAQFEVQARIQSLFGSTTSKVGVNSNNENSNEDNDKRHDGSFGDNAQPAADDEARIGAAAFLAHLVNLILHLTVCDLVFQFASVHFPSMTATLVSSSSEAAAAEDGECTTTTTTATKRTKLHYNNEERRSRRREEEPTRGSSATSFARVFVCVPAPEVDANKKVTELLPSVVGKHASAATAVPAPETGGLNPEACLAAALFACHPIHVEAVTSLVGRAELMATLFGMLSLQNMIEYLLAAAMSTGGADGGGGCWLYRVFGPLTKSAVWAVAALLSKENSSAMILINTLIALWLWLGVAASGRREAPPGSSNGAGRCDTTTRPLGSRCKRAVCVMMALLIAYSAHRFLISGPDVLPKFSSLDNPLAQDEHQFCATQTADRDQELCSDGAHVARIGRSLLMTRLYLPVFAFGLLVNPSVLSYDWPLSSIGPIQEPYEPRALLAVVIYLAALIPMAGWTIKQLQAGIGLFHRRREINGREEGAAAILEATQQASDTGRQAATAATDELLDDELSETSSVRSIDTLKSADSGFADVSPRPQTPASEPDKQSAAAAAPPLDTQSEGSESDKENERLAKWRQSLSRPTKRAAASLAPSKQQQQQQQQQRHQEFGQQKREPDSGAGSRPPSVGHNRLVWSLMLLVVPYLPASNLLVPVGLLVAERTLYLPSVGFCLLAGHLLDHLALKIGALIFQSPRSASSKHGKQTKRHRFIGQSKFPPAALQHSERAGRFERLLGLVFEWSWLRWLLWRLPRPASKWNAPKNNNRGPTEMTGASTAVVGGGPTKLDRRGRAGDGGRAIDWPTGIRAALVLPLLVMGSLKIYSRNLDWRNEFSLFSSNIEQSPAKSLANLASLRSALTTAGTNGFGPAAWRQRQPAASSTVETLRLYQRALALEPHSADLHYNL